MFHRIKFDRKRLTLLLCFSVLSTWEEMLRVQCFPKGHPSVAANREAATNPLSGPRITFYNDGQGLPQEPLLEYYYDNDYFNHNNEQRASPILKRSGYDSLIPKYYLLKALSEIYREPGLSNELNKRKFGALTVGGSNSDWENLSEIGPNSYSRKKYVPKEVLDEVERYLLNYYNVNRNAVDRKRTFHPWKG
ncbi:unnamed protein product [Gordionus sp. m RMFG-2023]